MRIARICRMDNSRLDEAKYSGKHSLGSLFHKVLDFFSHTVKKDDIFC